MAPESTVQTSHSASTEAPPLTGPSPNLIGRLRSLPARFYAATPGWKTRALLIGISILFYVLWNGLASTRQLWHDELFTFYIATAPSVSRLWQELNLDLNPPLNYLAVRIAVKLLGTSELAVRMPAMLAFLGASICFWIVISRRLGSFYGLLAVLCLWATPFFYYATEARAYGLVLFFFSLALLAWERALEDRRPAWAVPLLAVAVVGMALSHLFVVFYLIPFGLAELFRTWSRRRIDWPVWGALLLPCVIPILFIKIVAHYQQGAISWPFRAGLPRAILFYYKSLSAEAPVYLVCMASAVLLFKRPKHSNIRISAPRWVLYATLLALPVVMNVLLRLIHGGFFDRYSIPTALAFAFLVTLAIARGTNLSEVAAAWCCWILLANMLVFNQVPQRAMAFLRGTHRANISMFTGRPEAYESEMAQLEAIDPDLPLVAASGLTWIEMDRYEPAATVNRLYYLSDRKLALKYANALIFEGFKDDKEYMPLRAHVVPYEEFLAQHKQFLVLGTPDYTEDWLIPALLHEKASLRYLGTFDGPYKDHELFEVTMK